MQTRPRGKVGRKRGTEEIFEEAIDNHIINTSHQRDVPVKNIVSHIKEQKKMKVKNK